MKIRFAITGIVWLACAAVMSSAPQAPSHVDLSKLPAPARATIEAETKNATIKNVSSWPLSDPVINTAPQAVAARDTPHSKIR